jgi:hypothetical protein
MKNSIKTILVTLLSIVIIIGCKNDKPVKLKTEAEIYSEMKKSLDSFINQAASAVSIHRIKKVAKRIDQIGVSEELVLDTLPDNSKITYKKVNGKLEFYLKDEVTAIQLYSVHVKESLSGTVVALELFENVRRRHCEHVRKVCNDPELTFTEVQKLMCELEIKLWCN